jgi:ABC-type multidrug transport system fused ATPase/permease subunit
MKVIKKIDVISLAKIMGVIYGGVYLIIGLALNLAVLIFGIPAFKQFDFVGFGSGVLATLLVAVLVAAVSFVIGLVIGWLYNLAASLVGGIGWHESEVKIPGRMFEKKTETKEEPKTEEHLTVSDRPQQEINSILDQRRE